jgi:hypothetical protein
MPIGDYIDTLALSSNTLDVGGPVPRGRAPWYAGSSSPAVSLRGPDSPHLDSDGPGWPRVPR